MSAVDGPPERTATPLTPLEISSSVVVGGAAAPRGSAAAPATSSVEGSSLASRAPAAPVAPIDALLDAVRPAVARAPCLVSFSGGYDSTLVLAAATRVARAEGHPDPVPITWRAASDAPKAEESSWQDAVMRELGLADWVRLETGEQLDFAGPVARAVLEEHGLLYPANTHLHAPLIERAAGGSLLTGIGGDQIFGLWRWKPVADALAGRAPRSPRAAAQFVRSRLPLGARQAIERRRNEAEPFPWLHPPVVSDLHRRRMGEIAAEPAIWSQRVPWQAGRRRVTLGTDALATIGFANDVRVGHPLLDPAFVDAVARAGGRHGFGRRSEAFAQLFPDLLPEALSGRQTKATFGEVFWRDASTQAARAWDGTGVDATIVDVEALRAHWRGPDPSLLTALLLQETVVIQRARREATEHGDPTPERRPVPPEAP